MVTLEEIKAPAPTAEDLAVLVRDLLERVARLEKEVEELRESMESLGAEIASNEEIMYRYAQGLKW